MSEVIPGGQVKGVTVIGVADANGNATAPTAIPVDSASTSKGYKQATSTGTAGLLSALVSGGIPTGATKVLMIPTADIRLRDDGTNPTSSVGYLVPANIEWNYDGDQLAALKIINAATIDCWFYA